MSFLKTFAKKNESKKRNRIRKKSEFVRNFLGYFDKTVFCVSEEDFMEDVSLNQNDHELMIFFRVCEKILRILCKKNFGEFVKNCFPAECVPKKTSKKQKF